MCIQFCSYHACYRPWPLVDIQGIYSIKKVKIIIFTWTWQCCDLFSIQLLFATNLPMDLWPAVIASVICVQCLGRFLKLRALFDCYRLLCVISNCLQHLWTMTTLILCRNLSLSLQQTYLKLLSIVWESVCQVGIFPPGGDLESSLHNRSI